MEKAIHIENLSKSYLEKKALDRVNLSVNKGELFGLIGPDGAGKTTLFRIIASLLLPDQGTLRVANLDPVADYRKLRTRIGYMPGKFSLYQDLTVEENLSFFATVFGTTIAENYHLIQDIYQQIEPFKHRLAGKLSGGMKQKLALSCALIHKPEVLILDEPTTGVDAVSRKEFWDMLGKLKAFGITIIVATPYMDEASLCDRVALIQNGQLLYVASPADIVSSYARDLWAVKAKDQYALLALLREHPACHSAFAFGEFVHFATPPKSITAKELLEYLNEKGVAQAEVKPTTANIEDCFMDLM